MLHASTSPQTSPLPASACAPAPSTLTFGTYRTRGPAAAAAVRAALEAGVSRIDTAQLYGNERVVYRAIREFEARHPERAPVHVTSKLYDDLTFEQALARVRESAHLLGRPLDVMLLHRPLPPLVWAALSAAVDEGLVRSLGVSNHSVADLEKLLALCKSSAQGNSSAQGSGSPTLHKPTVNQIEFHPWVGPVQRALAYCRAQGIGVQGHTMLARGEMLDFQPLAELAARHGRSPAVIVLRWAHQLGVEIVFHTEREAHLREVIEQVHAMTPGLSAADMAQINAFHCAETRRFFNPPPRSASHPELSALTDTDAYVAAAARLLRADLEALDQGAAVSRVALCLHTRTNRELLGDPVAQRIALELFPLAEGKTPQSSHQRYRDAVRALRASICAADQAAAASGQTKKKSCSLPPGHPATKPLPVVNGEPVLAAIAEPTPMPVEVAPLDSLRPFFDFVADPRRLLGPNAPTGAPLTFERGTFFGDARMDLCKQVVGPDHIGALCEAVAAQAARPTPASYRVRHFLLGNNLACDGASTAGAEAMAGLMRDPRVDIETWYLAGNCVGPEDAAVLCRALEQNTSAKALWLKRNPIGAEGARHLGRMLGRNRTLALLDLHNTGLFDEGTRALAAGLRETGSELRLRHLYASANALTDRSVAALAQTHALGSVSSLRSLSLSINRLGNAGLHAMTAWIESGALADLHRLDLGSIGLSRPSLARLVDALIASCPKLAMLDLGTYLSTRDLGEKANALDPDVDELVRLLQQHPTLELLGVFRCGLPEESLARLVDALGPRQSLDGAGKRGLRHTRAERRFLKHPPRVVHIDSVYRGRD